MVSSGIIRTFSERKSPTPGSRGQTYNPTTYNPRIGQRNTYNPTIYQPRIGQRHTYTYRKKYFLHNYYSTPVRVCQGLFQKKPGKLCCKSQKYRSAARKYMPLSQTQKNPKNPLTNAFRCGIILYVEGKRTSRQQPRESGGTGRRARLRGVWFLPYGFKSRFSHHARPHIADAHFFLKFPPVPRRLFERTISHG